MFQRAIIPWLLLCASSLAAENQEEQIRQQIVAIRTNPMVEGKKAANQMLAEIGLPALAPLMNYLHEVAEAKPNDEKWISPGYIEEAIATVCKRGGEPAEEVIFIRFVTATNETERDSLFRSLADGSSYPKALVPDNDPPEYPMTLTVRTLPPKEKAERITALRESLDERKRQYGETMEVSPSAP
jgi:hypothetical protein